MARSRLDRLARREERQIVGRIVKLSILSAILAVFLFTLGIPLLGKLADFADRFKKVSNVSTKNVPQAPHLDNLPEATNSARIPISGFSQDGTNVEIFNGSDKVGEVKVVDGKFVFENFNLKKGVNSISAKAVNDGMESPASDVKKVLFDTQEPKLEVDSPSDGQNFSSDNRIKVSGKTDRDAQVFANGFLASVNADGAFEVFVRLAEGDNTIEIKAVDSAGNTKVEKRKVTFKK